jgi:hypothetical protein
MMDRLPESPGVFAALTMVRGSIWSSDFIVGAGGPGGVRLPWAKAVESCELRVASASKVKPVMMNFGVFFILDFVVVTFDFGKAMRK